MANGTVILDFDSTLISCESLEQILDLSIGNRADVMRRVKDITKQGMAGEISFAESLSCRLRLAAPSIQDIERFGSLAGKFLTPGMESFVKGLLRYQVHVHIVSGGLREAILPFAELLGIPFDRVYAVRLKWSEIGHFDGIDQNDPFSISKVKGLRNISSDWPRPVISIGDGMTDYALFEEQLVDHFVAFTQHVRRKSVIEKGVPEARNVIELQEILERIYGAVIFE